MYIGRKLNLPLYGVNLPNVFILTYKDSRYPQFYINAYNKGLIFTRDDIANYLNELKLEPNDLFMEPCSSVEIVKRSLRNLQIAYNKAGEVEKNNEVSELLDLFEGFD